MIEAVHAVVPSERRPAVTRVLALVAGPPVRLGTGADVRRLGAVGVTRGTVCGIVAAGALVVVLALGTLQAFGDLLERLGGGTGDDVHAPELGLEKRGRTEEERGCWETRNEVGTKKTDFAGRDGLTSLARASGAAPISARAAEMRTLSFMLLCGAGRGIDCGGTVIKRFKDYGMRWIVVFLLTRDKKTASLMRSSFFATITKKTNQHASNKQDCLMCLWVNYKGLTFFMSQRSTRPSSL